MLILSYSDKNFIYGGSDDGFLNDGYKEADYPR